MTSLSTSKPLFELGTVIKVPEPFWASIFGKPSSAQNKARICGVEYGPDNRRLKGAGCNGWVYTLVEVVDAPNLQSVIIPQRMQVSEERLQEWTK